MSKQQKTLRIPHGVVFLYDPEMIIDVPEDTSAGPVLGTSSCISIRTLHEVDGKVDLIISDEKLDIKEPLRYEGTIIAEYNRVSFNDSSTKEIIGLDVDCNEVEIAIFSDDRLTPEKVICLIGRHNLAC